MSGPILFAYLDLAPDEIELPVAPGGWAEHFLRGLASLGLIGVAKVLYLVGPSSFFSVRTSRPGRGRERVGRFTWVMIAFGVAQFFAWLWRRVEVAVNEWMVMGAAEVMEVGDGGDGDDRPVAVPLLTKMLAGVETVKTWVKDAYSGQIGGQPPAL